MLCLKILHLVGRGEVQSIEVKLMSASGNGETCNIGQSEYDSWENDLSKKVRGVN